jgi:hypothetical protein
MADEIEDDLNFEKLIENFNEPEKFLARQIRKVQIECQKRRPCGAINFTRKQIATGVGGIVGIAGALYALVDAIRALVSH